MSLSCILIGQDNLLIQCASHLLENHHEIKWIVSPVESIRIWCNQNNIPCLDSLNQLSENREHLVDYLFSIVNGVILKKSDLNIARYGTINYHDSLLPQYAGVHATSWAILNGEKNHGITWHMVTEGIDEGDIVYQKSFPLEENETALTLNVKCFNEAAEGFSEIIQKIEFSSLTKIKQDKDKRSYYGLTHPLPDLGFINWATHDADYIATLCRALDFGSYKNNLGTLKLLIKSTYLIVLEVEKLDQPCKIQSGQLLSIEQNGLVVSTKSTPILIKKLMTPHGSVVMKEELMNIYQLNTGDHLPLLDKGLLQDQSVLYSQALKNESFWIRQLNQIVDHAIYSDRIFEKEKNPCALNSISIDNNINHNIDYPHLYFFAAIFIYLYRLNNYEQFTIFFKRYLFPEIQEPLNHLWSTLLPITPDFDSSLTCKQVLEKISGMIDLIFKHDHYLSDIHVRQPSLSSLMKNCIISLECNGGKMIVPEHSLLHFHIDQRTNELHIAHRINMQFQGGIMAPLIENISTHLNNILQCVLHQPETALHKIVFITRQEQQKLFEWGVGEYIPLPSNTITDLFEYAVHHTPHHFAIHQEDENITYHNLWQKAEKIANFINRLNLEPQHHVGLCADPGIDMIASVLGMIKSGCICMPLSTNDPMIFQRDLSHILVSDSFFQIHENNDLLLQVHSIQHIISNHSNYGALVNRSLSHHTAMIVVNEKNGELEKLTHKNLINYGFWFNDAVNFTQVSAFDLSPQLSLKLFLLSLFGPLFIGGTLSITAGHSRANPKKYLDELRNQNVSHVRLTPEDWNIFTTHPNEIRELNQLKYVFSSEPEILDEAFQLEFFGQNCQLIVVPEAQFQSF